MPSVLQVTHTTHFVNEFEKSFQESESRVFWQVYFALTYDVDLDIFSFVAWSLELKCGQFSCIEVTHGFAFEFAFFSSSPKN